MTPTRHLEVWLEFYREAHGDRPGGPPSQAAQAASVDESLRRAAYSIEWLDRHRPRKGNRAGRPASDENGVVPGLPATLSFPLELGPFRIHRELGRGGFGVVLLAERLPDGPPIALKLPRPELLVDEVLLGQFLQEARVAAVLDHPNLIRVSDVGTIGPLHYVSTPYFPGPTLSQWLAECKGPVPIADAVAIVTAIGDGLQHAHDRGVLHRDVSPQNIILVPPEAIAGLGSPPVAGRTGMVPMLGDFGLATAIGDVGADDPVPLAGTLDYLAPEAVDPLRGPVGPATDLYALGAVLYELLAGHPPFRSPSREETLRRIVEERPVPLRTIRPEIPESVDRACLRCLSNSPEGRDPSVSRFIESLCPSLDGDRPRVG